MGHVRKVNADRQFQVKYHDQLGVVHGPSFKTEDDAKTFAAKVEDARIVRRQVRWQANYIAENGQKKSRVFATEKDAKAFLARTLVALERGEFVDPRAGKVTVAKWSETWLDVVRTTLKPKTVAGYDSLLRSRILPTFGPMSLSSLRPSHVQAWIGAMQSERLSPSRIRGAHVVLSSMLDMAVTEPLISRNVARGARLPMLARKEAAFLDTETIDALIAETPEQYRAFIALQGVVGLRFGEGAALRRRHVNLLRRRVRVEESLAEISGDLIFGDTKSHAIRSVPLPPSLVELLARHMESVPFDQDALLFTSSRGLPLRYSRFRPTVWMPLLAHVGVPHVPMHTLRHSAAARMIQAGWSAKAVQTVLGHANAGFTLTVYGHLFDDDLDVLAESLDGSSERFQSDSEPIRTSPR